MKILGVDPGLVKTGWGLIQTHLNRVTYLDHGLIVPNKNEDIFFRLGRLHQQLGYIVNQHKPDCVVFEETFVNKNPTSSLKLAMARGALISSVPFYNIPVFEYGANKIKKTVVGSGHAEKNQVINMLGFLLPTAPKDITSDAADALAVALCHWQHNALQSHSLASA